MTRPPPLRDDCFAMPRGVDWVRLEDALSRLQNSLSVRVDVEKIPTYMAHNRILAQDIIAPADHPPFANSAIDGYGFAYDCMADHSDHAILPLCDGRACAGQAFNHHVPYGQAIRILTGAPLPMGVDTVILQEDVTIKDSKIHFYKGLKARANTRPKGEDIKTGTFLFAKGHRIRPSDIGVLSSVQSAQVLVYKRLRIAVIATGDELVSVGQNLEYGQISNANTPMLCAAINAWGFEAIDMGIMPDNLDIIRNALNMAASSVDAIITTGGASAGDEDHISKLLTTEGNLQTWRIAIKPGRPLALAIWNGIPVFGFPGNPVAAMVCHYIFGRPAFSLLAGEGWQSAKRRKLPANFEKQKKSGRHEYLRARLNADEEVEIFKNEGSGRISSLSWADGLVELEFNRCHIHKGDLVNYISF